MTIPVDNRVVYIVCPFEYDYTLATQTLALYRDSNTVWIRTGDLTAPFDTMTSTNAIVWLFALWTRDTPPDVLEQFGELLDSARNRGVLVDTF